ncbi:hypothetical protein Acid345_3381 [Candidatus Koribacter versatilis Ellin345]|uniref:Uncharacterized protein n=1 Tax=Koribacter versatilis (strain Ellin345) TaxID=204669 RepID=Q1IL68_KORVE|nr:hypothetical protein Acid345_3381 [Candidatus Koribacter versatilis Ellin345]
MAERANLQQLQPGVVDVYEHRALAPRSHRELVVGDRAVVCADVAEQPQQRCRTLDVEKRSDARAAVLGHRVNREGFAAHEIEQNAHRESLPPAGGHRW